MLNPQQNTNTLKATMNCENKYKPLPSAGCDFTQLSVVPRKEVEDGVVHSLQAIPVLCYILLTDHLPNRTLVMTYSELLLHS